VLASGVNLHGDWMHLVIDPENSEEAIEKEYPSAKCDFFFIIFHNL